MTQFTRRTFLQRSSAAMVAAGAMAAAAPGVPAVVGALADTGPADTGAAESAVDDVESTSSGEPLIAHVRDLATGEIGLFAGTREVTVVDPSLAARLLRSMR